MLPPRSLKTADLVLSFSEGTLSVEGPGIAGDIPAIGVGPGRARIPAYVVPTFATALPAGDPVILEFSDGRLVVRGVTTFRIKGAWEDTSPKRIEVVLDLSDRDLVKVRARDSLESILSSGLRKSTQAAEQRFQKAIDAAQQPLERYSIAREDLERVIRDLITS